MPHCLLPLPVQDALQEQGEEIVKALDRDPLAGRHEMMKQEQVKLAREAPTPATHRWSVKEWQQMKHNDLR